VRLVVGGRPLTLAIDTGNPQSALSTSAANTLGLTVLPIAGPDGKPLPGLGRTSIDGLAVGGTQLAHTTFLVLDLSKSIADGTMPKVDGTLGYMAFKDRQLTLSHGSSIAVSGPLTTAAACSTGKISLITFGRKGPPIVTTTGFTLNGQPLSAQLDTMYTGSLLIYPQSVKKLGLAAISGSGVTEHFPFTDDGVDMRQAGSTTQGFAGLILAKGAPVYFVTPGVHVPDGLFDGTVGWALLHSREIVLEFHNLCFDLRPAASLPPQNASKIHSPA
jgi:hypothetical protein